MKKILILEANSNQAMAIAKYIKMYSDYLIIGAIEKNRKFIRNNFDKIVISKLSGIDIKQYDYILPMGAGSTYNFISKYKKLNYNNGIFFSKDNLIVFDKPKMLKIANETNIPIPKTYLDKNDIKDFPIFYKEDFENGGGTRGVAYNKDTIPNKSSLIYQEYINTPSTYGVGFLAKNGKIETFFIHKEMVSYPIDGGSSVAIKKFYDKRLIEYTEKLIKKLNYNGWGLAEYKYCNKRDDFVFMEINAKFWASIEFMLMNNNQFLSKLLDIKYQNKKIERVLFINRFFQYDLKDMFTNLKYLLYIPYIRESSIIYQITRKFIPNIFVDFVKRVKNA